MAKLKVLKTDRTEGEPFEVAPPIAEAVFNPFLIRDAVVYHRALHLYERIGASIVHAPVIEIEVSESRHRTRGDVHAVILPRAAQLIEVHAVEVNGAAADGNLITLS